MSKHSTFSTPAISASSSAPPAPPAGPERTVSAAWDAARSGRCEPARGLHDLGLDQPARGGLGGQPAQVGAHERAERRVEHGRGGALVLAERAHQLAGHRHVRRGWQALGQQTREQALVLGVRVGVQQRDRHRLGLGRGDLVGQFARPARGRARAADRRARSARARRSAARRRPAARAPRRTACTGADAPGGPARSRR